MSDAHSISSPATPVNLRKAFYVFGGQLLITAMLVTAYYLPWGTTPVNMAFTVALALGQAALVLCFSMHFISERKFIYGVALFTVIFLSVMLYIILTGGSASGHLHVNHVS
jgi:predicted ferric reductase